MFAITHLVDGESLVTTCDSYDQYNDRIIAYVDLLTSISILNEDLIEIEEF